MFHMGTDGVMTFVTGSGPLEASWFVRLNQAGEVLVEEVLEENPLDFGVGCRGLFRLQDGNFFVIGTDPRMYDDHSSFMQTAIIDSTGTLLAFNTYPDSAWCILAINDAVMDSDGNILASCARYEYGTSIMKFSPSGEFLLDIPVSHGGGYEGMPSLASFENPDRVLVGYKPTPPEPNIVVIEEITEAGELLPFFEFPYVPPFVWAFEFAETSGLLTLLCGDVIRRYTPEGGLLFSRDIDFFSSHANPCLSWNLYTFVFEPETQLSVISQYSFYDFIIAKMDWEGNVSVEDEESIEPGVLQDIPVYPNPVRAGGSICFLYPIPVHANFGCTTSEGSGLPVSTSHKQPNPYPGILSRNMGLACPLGSISFISSRDSQPKQKKYS